MANNANSNHGPGDAIDADDDNDQDVALCMRGSQDLSRPQGPVSTGAAPTSQRRAALLKTMGVPEGLSRSDEDALIEGEGVGRKGKSRSKLKAARQRRRRLS